MEQIKPTFDTGLACFAIMASYFEKPISIEQVKHKYDRQDSNSEELCDKRHIVLDIAPFPSIHCVRKKGVTHDQNSGLRHRT